MNRYSESSSRQHKRHGHDSVDMITILLSDGPKSISQMEQNFIELPRRFGMFIELFDREALEIGELTNLIYDELQKMIRKGLVERHGELYQLTQQGQEKYSGQAVEFQKLERLLNNLASPLTVGKVSLAVHLLLAAVKLPAGIISGSIGLLNDAIDTLLDGLSSILVLLGIRHRKEKAANVVLVMLMLITGGVTVVEAVNRLINPIPPQVDWFPIFSALMSAALCTGLYFYQRFVGLRSGSLSLITQSVDSRNHIIVAVSVIAGLVAALLDFPLLDTIVGLGVALIILYSALQLAIEIFKNFQSGENDLSRFSMGLSQRYQQFRTNQLRYWLLFMIDEEKITQRKQIIQRALQVLDFSANPALAQLGLNKPTRTADEIEHALSMLQQNGHLKGYDPMVITPKGYKKLSEIINHRKFFRTHFQ